MSVRRVLRDKPKFIRAFQDEDVSNQFCVEVCASGILAAAKRVAARQHIHCRRIALAAGEPRIDP